MLKEREMGADAARPRQSVQSVERTLDLLEALAAAQGEISITNLAGRTGLHVSTVHRLLATLVHRGYVRQNRESSRYYLGSKLALLGEGAPRYTELRLQAQTALSALTDLIDETSNLVVLEDTAAVYIDQVQCKQVVRLFTAIGNRVPLQCTAAGKVLLAYVSGEGRDRIIERLDFRSYTPRSIASRSALVSALDTVRRNGYALDEEEYQTGVRCVAVPIVGSDGQPVAAISVSAPAHRLPRARAAEVLPAMKRAAAAVAANMGASKR
ncbi:MAG TPA: IclR family transcriptional regulator [Candidatus Dormibacteraeota bacterium]|jgi:IclR family acetate operon transcriptional repressor|nr:IclR family transcriptional regulator [Candidatus Dormibacteraeota bacterium]